MKRRYHEDLEAARAKTRLAAKRFREMNPARVVEYSRRTIQRWRERDPEGYRMTRRLWTALRRAKIRGRTIEKVSLERIMARDSMRCHICKTKVRREDLEFDHVIPIAAGGEHTESNIAVSHGHCNRRKSSKVLTLF